MPEQQRMATLERIRDYLSTQAETSGGEFALPLLTGVLRVRKLRERSNRA
jgi:hypothetical protein